VQYVDHNLLQAGAVYDLDEEIDLSALEPLIAPPTSPGNVVPVREVSGEPIGQAVIDSPANPGLRDFAMAAAMVKAADDPIGRAVIDSPANPGLRDFAVAAAMVRGRQTDDAVSFDVNPTSREILQDLTRCGAAFDLIAAGARIHQAGCLGCIGMGQALAAGRNSLRTFPRNFPGRSGTEDNAVWLCSPETAAASALTGVITPRHLGLKTVVAESSARIHWQNLRTSGCRPWSSPTRPTTTASSRATASAWRARTPPSPRRRTRPAAAPHDQGSGLRRASPAVRRPPPRRPGRRHHPRTRRARLLGRTPPRPRRAAPVSRAYDPRSVAA
jgi:aconitate hydratase